MDLIQNNNLDDFMPKDLQNRYLYEGLETFAKVLGENKFEELYKTVMLVNRIGE